MKLSNTILNDIKQHYSASLTNSTILFRGSENARLADNLLTKVEIRQDRTPLDSDSVHSSIFNLAFEYYHKITRIRQRVMFSHSDVSSSVTYGAAHVVIPPDDAVLIQIPLNDSADFMEIYSDSIINIMATSLNIPSHTIYSEFSNIETVAELKQNPVLYDGFVKVMDHKNINMYNSHPKFLKLQNVNNFKLRKFKDGSEVMILSKTAYLMTVEAEWEPISASLYGSKHKPLSKGLDLRGRQVKQLLKDIIE